MPNAPQVFLLGDVSAASPFIPFAKQKLHAIQLLGLDYANKTFSINDVEIRIKTAPSGDKIWIKAPEVCPAIMFSGLLDTFNARVRDPGHTPQYLIDKQLEDEHRVAYATDGMLLPAKLLSGVHSIDPASHLVTGLSGDATPVATQGVDGDLYTRTGSPNIWRKESGNWAEIVQDANAGPLLTNLLPVEKTLTSTTEDGTPYNTVDFSIFRETYDKLLPSKFTGLMRQVVQATFATSAWSGFAATINPIKAATTPINYQHGDSWGCVKHSDKYYFIEITTDSVYYVPADYCIQKQKNNLGVTVSAVILRSVALSKKVKIGEIPSGFGTSWDQEIGWAFSYTAPEASIIYNRYDGYVTTSLLTMTFTFDATTGLPSNASVAATAPKILWNPLGMTGRYPTDVSLLNVVTDMGAAFGGVQNKTVDFGKQYLGQQGPYVDDVPVYVYYTESAGQQLCTYSRVLNQASGLYREAPALGTGTRSDGSTVTDYDPAIYNPWVGTKNVDASVTYGFSVAGSPIPQAEGNTTLDYAAWTWGMSGGTQESSAAYESYYTYDLFWSRPPLEDGTNPSQVVSGSSGYTYGSVDIGYKGRETVTASGGAVSVNMALTLSVLDREAALVYSDSASLSSTRHVTTNTWYYERLGPSPYTDSASRRQGIHCRVGDSRYPPCGSLGTAGVFETNPHAASGSFAHYLANLTDTPNASFFTAGRVATSGICADGSNFTTIQTTVGRPTNTDETYNHPAASRSSLVLYGNFQPRAVSIENAGLIRGSVHPLAPLQFYFAQAAFNPENYILHKDGITSPLVAKISGATYDIAHRLIGWIGVV